MEVSVSQLQILQDSIVRHIITRFGTQDPVDACGDLNEFDSFLATELLPTIPSSLRDATYETRNDVPNVEEVSLDALSATFSDTLISYNLCDDTDSVNKFVRKILEDYVEEACAPPPIWSSTRTSECEICEREVPLSYHHLIPRSTHDKVLKRKWHPESQLNSVAWLCRPCHSAVHRSASNEELAREYYTVEKLLQREDLQKWARYISKQRWAPRPYRKH